MTVTIGLSTNPFCCGVPRAVYSKIIHNSFLSDTLLRCLFSSALSHLIIFTWILCLAFKSFIQTMICSICSFIYFKKKLFLYFVASSTNIMQCCLPPIFAFLIDEMSKYILSSGFLHLFSLGYFSVLSSPMSSSGNY